MSRLCPCRFWGIWVLSLQVLGCLGAVSAGFGVSRLRLSGVLSLLVLGFQLPGLLRVLGSLGLAWRDRNPRAELWLLQTWEPQDPPQRMEEIWEKAKEEQTTPGMCLGTGGAQNPPSIHPQPSQSKPRSQTGFIPAQLGQQKAEQGTGSPKSLDFSPCCCWEETQRTREGRWWGERLINEIINQRFRIPGWMQVGHPAPHLGAGSFPYHKSRFSHFWGDFFGI